MSTHLIFKWEWDHRECELWLKNAMHPGMEDVHMDIWDMPDSNGVGKILRRTGIGVPFKVHLEITIS